MTLGISPDSHSMVIKFTIGLHAQMNTLLSLFKVHDISSTSKITIMIERKIRIYNKRTTEKDKEGCLKAKKKSKNSKNASSSKRSDVFWDHYKIVRRDI